MLAFNPLLLVGYLLVGTIQCSVALLITSNPTDVTNTTFTHVIVGGGTAGLTVASRLAEDSRFKILVVEAGPDEQNNTLISDPETEIPAVIAFSWFYFTTAQAVGGKAQTIVTGKVLGGSSATNGMQWTRGTTYQYNAWERLGNPGWNAASLFTYMKKAETFHVPNANQVSLGATSVPSVHGTQGPISASYPLPYLGTVSFQDFITSFLSAVPSLTQILDLCTGSPNGVARFFYSMIPGPSADVPGQNKRSSAAVGYVYPFVNQANAKSNLIILVGHQVTSINWGTGALARASGVSFAATPTEGGTITGPTFTVNASSEVILSAGAIGSPHLLELSGIGDRNILQPLGIPVKVHLPSVGTNFQDQPLVASSYSIAPTVPPADVDTSNQIPEGSVSFLNINQIPGFNGTAASAFLLGTTAARAQAIVNAGAFTSESGLQKILRIQAEGIAIAKDPVVESSFAVNGSPGQLTNLAWNLLPQVRGTVHAVSSNPAVLPAVNPNYLTTQFELDLKANATKLSRTVFNIPPLSTLVGAELSPGTTAVPVNATDAQWQAFVKDNYQPTLHPLGTVPMLPRVDGGAVDSNLRVYGTANVRVVDASIMPIQISAHLSATVYGIAEKAADMIKASFPA